MRQGFSDQQSEHITFTEHPMQQLQTKGIIFMAKTQTPRATNAFNFLTRNLLRAGIRIGNMTLLTVRGRKSGQPRTTPLWLSEHDGQRWLVCPYGQAQWVRNLRAAGEATLTRGRRTEHVYAVELSPQEAAPLLKISLAETPSFLLSYYDVKRDSPLADFEREVPAHPVFLMKHAEK